MTFDKLRSYLDNSLPYPRNIILSKMVEVLVCIPQKELLYPLERTIKESAPGAAYADIIYFVNNKLPPHFRANFYKIMTRFAKDEYCLEWSEEDMTSFSQEIYRAFRITV
ncbi:hypothetical protein CDJ04_13950 [Salmonella enterica]|nr:hypothetical protein [Salmonella enterica]EBZ5138243.1 hypothetical protein [Salmonella enterica subsp. enterica serovar Antsalova]ECS6899734.1 hypothetical protein [Salmonella enterica]EHI8599367.1 hypothetical protein [Salmonella enterica subsp. enterica serovar 51:z:1,5]EHI8983519.1 hypothetical protein [Salmonella enterica subsp. enterica serovar 51:z:1,5]